MECCGLRPLPGAAEAGIGGEWGGGGRCVWTKSTPVNCKADRLSVICTSRAKMPAIHTRHDKTTLLVTKGDNGHFRTLRAITYKNILNKSNAILAACLHLLATFGLECRAFACKKIPSGKKWRGAAPPLPPVPPLSKVGASPVESAAYVCYSGTKYIFHRQRISCEMRGVLSLGQVTGRFKNNTEFCNCYRNIP